MTGFGIVGLFRGATQTKVSNCVELRRPNGLEVPIARAIGPGLVSTQNKSKAQRADRSSHSRSSIHELSARWAWQSFVVTDTRANRPGY